MQAKKHLSNVYDLHTMVMLTAVPVALHAGVSREDLTLVCPDDDDYRR